MSKRTIDVHWGELHRNFVEGLNKQLEKDDILYGYTMDELVKETYNNGNPLPEFNNVAEVTNYITYMRLIWMFRFSFQTWKLHYLIFTTYFIMMELAAGSCSQKNVLIRE